MKTHDQDHPTEMPEACATTPMGRAIRLIGDAWILLIIINLLRGPKRFNALRVSWSIYLWQVTTQHSSPHELDKSALYGGSQGIFLLRAWQPQAAMPAAEKDASRCRVPI